VTPVWVVLVAALAMGVVGHLTGRELATGGYRIDDDEAEHAPGRNWWPGVATAALAALAAWSVGDLGGWAALPAYLLFGWLTVGLVWIDLDVHRLPVGLVVPTSGWLFGLLAVASVATGDLRWLAGLVGALVMGAVYLLISVLPGGGVGGGDVRLAPVIGGLLGWLGLAPFVVGLMAGFFVGGVAAVALLALRRVGLRTSIAYGPAMCLGAWLAIAFSSRIMTSVVGG
jgi:leader peptidase (prepilin peptidase)/N-methyltransferase